MGNVDDPIRPDDVIPPEGGGGLQVQRLAKDGLLLIPNLLKLLGRLLKDPRVPRRSKLIVAAAIGYAASPVDLIPEFIPVVGVLDDVILVVYAINHLIERAGEEVVLSHWDGPQDLLGLVRGILELVSDLVPRPLRMLLRRLTGA
jgi:uncharacterized membrane protein YkvA (DUF1232 family)